MPVVSLLLEDLKMTSGWQFHSSFMDVAVGSKLVVLDALTHRQTDIQMAYSTRRCSHTAAQSHLPLLPLGYAQSIVDIDAYMPPKHARRTLVALVEAQCTLSNSDWDSANPTELTACISLSLLCCFLLSF